MIVSTIIIPKTQPKMSFSYDNQLKRATEQSKQYRDQREPAKVIKFIFIIVLTIILTKTQPKHVI